MLDRKSYWLMSRSNAHNLVVKHLKIHHAQEAIRDFKKIFFLKRVANFSKTRLLDVFCEAREVVVGVPPL